MIQAMYYIILSTLSRKCSDTKQEPLEKLLYLKLEQREEQHE